MDNSTKVTCPHAVQCGSFYVYAKSLSEELYGTFHKMYCQGSYEKCARYMLIERGQADLLSADILPNQEIRARSLVKGDQKRYS